MKTVVYETHRTTLYVIVHPNEGFLQIDNPDHKLFDHNLLYARQFLTEKSAKNVIKWHIECSPIWGKEFKGTKVDTITLEYKEYRKV